MAEFNVEQVSWRQAKHQLKQLRYRVYVCEWRIPKKAEFDHLDSESQHVLVYDDNVVVATGRITPDGEIGRIAVVSSYRSKQIYDLLYNTLLAIAREQSLDQVFVQCELTGVPHFEQQGFESVGNVYMDAGIPRQKLRCDVDQFKWSRVELIH